MPKKKRNPTIKTYERIKEFLKKNKQKEFSITNIRNKLNIDFYSVISTTTYLRTNKLIKEKKGKFKWK